VPNEPTYSLLAKYSFLNGTLKGAYVGANWRHQGVAPGDGGNTFFMPSSDIIDAFVGYGRGRWNLQLNVMNLTNTDKVLTSIQDSLVYRAPDRTYRLTLNYTF
jgi:outer membrane receptor protein involved in Fe transport